MVTGEKKKFVMKPPQVVRIGTKKTSFANFTEICKMYVDDNFVHNDCNKMNNVLNINFDIMLHFATFAAYIDNQNIF